MLFSVILVAFPDEGEVETTNVVSERSLDDQRWSNNQWLLLGEVPEVWENLPKYSPTKTINEWPYGVMVRGNGNTGRIKAFIINKDDMLQGRESRFGEKGVFVEIEVIHGADGVIPPAPYREIIQKPTHIRWADGRGD